MQPYQEASEEIQRQGLIPHELLKRGTQLATSAVTGGLAVNKVIPFLNKFIPQALATKALAKIDPRFSKFISGAKNSGYAWDAISDFIKTQAAEGEMPKQKLGGLIRHYSDDLMDFLEEEVGKGHEPLVAAAVAKKNKKFANVIAKMEKEQKTNFDNIVGSIFGSPQQQMAPHQGEQQPQQQMDMFQGQQRGQQRQPSAGQQALMNSMQKLQAILEKNKR